MVLFLMVVVLIPWCVSFGRAALVYLTHSHKLAARHRCLTFVVPSIRVLDVHFDCRLFAPLPRCRCDNFLQPLNASRENFPFLFRISISQNTTFYHFSAQLVTSLGETRFIFLNLRGTTDGNRGVKLPHVRPRFMLLSPLLMSHTTLVAYLLN